MLTPSPQPRLLPPCRCFLLTLAVLTFATCGTVPTSAKSAGLAARRQIVVDDVLRASGLNALQILTRSMLMDAPTLETDGSLRCPQRVGRVGAPVVFLNGLRADPEVLQMLPAREMTSMRVVCSEEAVLRYGRSASGGAILIELRK